MKRISAVLLGTALLIALPAVTGTDPECDGEEREAQVVETPEQASLPEEITPLRAALQTPPIYVPRSRGSVPTRIGGGSRGV
jgi:hypothetical protein